MAVKGLFQQTLYSLTVLSSSRCQRIGVGLGQSSQQIAEEQSQEPDEQDFSDRCWHGDLAAGVNAARVNLPAGGVKPSGILNCQG